MTLPRLDDRWFTLDRPVLLATAQLLDAGRRPPLSSGAIAEAAAFPGDEVIAALGRLRRDYLDVADARTYDGTDWAVRALTADGLREVGLWPDAETALDRLVRALERAAEEAPTEQQPKIRRVLESIAGMGRELSVQVLGAVITGGITR